MGLLPRGGSRIGGAARVKPEDVPAVSAALWAQIQRDLQAERSAAAAVGSGAAAVTTKPGATVTCAAAGGSADAVVPSRAAVTVGSGAAAVTTKPGAAATFAAAGGCADAVVPSRAAVAVGSGAAAVTTKPGAAATFAAAGGSAAAVVPSRAAVAVGSGAAVSRVGPGAQGPRAQTKTVATKPGAAVTFATAGGSVEAVVPSRAAVAVGSGAAAMTTKPGAVVPSRAAVRSGAAVSRVGPGAQIRGGSRAQTKAVATRLGAAVGSVAAGGGAGDVSAAAPAQRTADLPVVAPREPVEVGSGDASSKLLLHSDENRVPSAVLEVVVDGATTAQTHHVLEQPLGDEARVAAGRTVGVLHRTVPAPAII